MSYLYRTLLLGIVTKIATSSCQTRKKCHTREREEKSTTTVARQQERCVCVSDLSPTLYGTSNSLSLFLAFSLSLFLRLSLSVSLPLSFWPSDQTRRWLNNHTTIIHPSVFVSSCVSISSKQLFDPLQEIEPPPPPPRLVVEANTIIVVVLVSSTCSIVVKSSLIEIEPGRGK